MFTGRANAIYFTERAMTARNNATQAAASCFVISRIGGQGKSELALKVATNLRFESVPFSYTLLSC